MLEASPDVTMRAVTQRARGDGADRGRLAARANAWSLRASRHADPLALCQRQRQLGGAGIGSSDQHPGREQLGNLA